MELVVTRAAHRPGSDPVGVDPLHGLVPTSIIAVSESQSSQRLAIYLNSIHTLTNLYDGFGLLSTIGQRIRQAIEKVLLQGDVRTPDLGGTANTTQVGEAIATRIAAG